MILYLEMACWLPSSFVTCTRASKSNSEAITSERICQDGLIVATMSSEEFRGNNRCTTCVMDDFGESIYWVAYFMSHVVAERIAETWPQPNATATPCNFDSCCHLIWSQQHLHLHLVPIRPNSPPCQTKCKTSSTCLGIS